MRNFFDKTIFGKRSSARRATQNALSENLIGFAYENFFARRRKVFLLNATYGPFP